MNSSKRLVIIDNEKISKKNNNFYCDNFEARISEDLNKIFDVTLIARKSKIESMDKDKLLQEVKLRCERKVVKDADRDEC